MTLLVIMQTEDKCYLLMTKNGDDSYAIQAYENSAKLMASFKYITALWISNDITWSASASIYFMETNPIAITAPDMEEIKKYVKGEKAVNISGGLALGRGYIGLEMDKEILKYKYFSVWSKSMELAGIKAPEDTQIDLFGKSL